MMLSDQPSGLRVAAILFVAGALLSGMWGCPDGRVPGGVGGCGNGIIEPGEQCDDGNAETEQCAYGDRSCVVCSSTCRKVAGATWFCGNEVAEAGAGEECDDGGNGDDCDGCLDNCKAYTNVCGDGLQCEPEECDQGEGNSDVDADTCRRSCRLPFCGDGVVDSDEECDDGNEDDSDACPDGEVGTCRPARCDDGLVWSTDGGSEVCDDGAENGAVSSTQAYCTPDCQGTQLCGNSVIEGSEVCDGDGSWCSTACTVNPSLALGGFHTCGILPNGSVKCWGIAGSGNCNYPFWECGQGKPPSEMFAQISSTWMHTYGLRPDGTAECWGYDKAGQCNTPAEQFVHISAGGVHTCGLRLDRSVACWGDGGGGRTSPPPGAFEQIEAGFWNTCGLRANGSVECWGGDSYGQTSGIPAGTFVQVSAGHHQACGLGPDGSLECWGAGTTVALCDPWGATGLRPPHECGQSIPPAGPFTRVSTGGWHTCGIRPDGTVECWGWNGQGSCNAPVGTFVDVIAGHSNTCGIRPDGSVECWGAGMTADSCDIDNFHGDCGQSMVPPDFP